jgi:hypothetical protein
MEHTDTPSIITQAKTLIEAGVQWAKDGFEKVPKQVFDKRHEICKGCEYWDSNGFGGLGKCKACGCSVAKLYLPHSTCPLPEPKWGTYLTTLSASLDK